MTLKVIGAGFGRTGTDSMREALAILGFGPCHHMFEVIASDEQKRLWRALAAGGVPDWSQLLAGFTSCMDWPSAFYWPQLIEAYQEAKVILTYRSAESWWDSFQKTILKRIEPGADPEALGVALIAKQVFGGHPEDRDLALAAYEANVAAVKAMVPPQRLLVHNLGDGWGPLCAHLGVAVPDQPYPNRNNTESFKARHEKD